MAPRTTQPAHPAPAPTTGRAALVTGLLATLLAAFLSAVLAVVLAAPAQAIVYGQPDRGEHPNVGSFVAEYTNPDTGQTNLVQLCTGTLIANDVVLSASHCFSGLPSSIGKTYFTLAEVIDADRNGVVDAGVQLRSGTAVTHPQYGTGGQANPFDIAVFLLDRPVTGVTPAPLAPAGYFNDAAAARQRTYTAVGYGTVRTSNHQGPQGFQVGWRREKADQHLLSITSAWVTFSMNLATGNGGTCYGDSGGPHFAGRTVVAITITGDAMCKATDKDYRIDTPWARDFLARFVTLP